MRLKHSLEMLSCRLRHLLANRGRQRRLVLAYCVAVILAYGVSVALTVRAGILPCARGDFVVYYTGARILRDGHPHQLYDLNLQARVQQRILQPYGLVFAGGLLPYNYPPFLAVMLTPLSFLPLRSAFLVWGLLNVALVVASVALLVDERGGSSREAFILTSVMTFAFFPVLEGLMKGQSVFLVLFALTLSYWALKRGRGYLAGASLALGLVKPHLIALIVIYLLYRRRWRALLGFGTVGALLLIPASALVGLQGLCAYAAVLAQESGWGELAHIHPSRMANVRGTVFRAGLTCQQWLNIQPSDAALTAATVVLSLGVLLLVLRSWHSLAQSGCGALDLQFALTLAAGLLVSPHLYGHDLSLLVLVGWLVLSYAAATARAAAARSMIAVGHLTALILPSVLPEPVDSQVLALLLLALLLVLARWAGLKRASPQVA